MQVGGHGKVQIFDAGNLIAEHDRLDGKYRTQVTPGHYKGILRRDRPAAVRVQDGSLWRQAEIAVAVRPMDVYEELAVTPLVGSGV